MGSFKLGWKNLDLTLHGFIQIGLQFRPNFTWVNFLLMQYEYKSTAAKTFLLSLPFAPLFLTSSCFAPKVFLCIQKQIHLFLSCPMWCVFHSCFLFSVHCMWKKKERLHCSLVKCSLSLKKMECKMLYNMQILTKGNQTRMLYNSFFQNALPSFFSSHVIVLVRSPPGITGNFEKQNAQFFIQDN